MVNLQADGLAQAILRSQNPKLHLLAFEPLVIKKSELKRLEEGGLIALGKKLPQLYIYRKGAVVGQAELGEVDGREAVVISAKERISNLGKTESKSVMLECRLAVLPKNSFVVGRLVMLPRATRERIEIFAKGRLLATASLVEDSEGYFLQIVQRHG